MSICLPTDSIDLWYTRVDRANSKHLLDQYRGWLTPQESERGERFIFDRVRVQYLITRGLVRWVLSSYCDVEPHQWLFEQGSHGKPTVSEPRANRYVFNLSHTEGLIVCGVRARGELGVDVEYLGRKKKSFGELARRFFAMAEADWFEQSPAALRSEAFFRIWTLKEAYIKAVGKGLAIPLDSFELIPPDRGQPVIRFTNNIDINIPWSFGQLRLGELHQVAIAADVDPNPLRLRVRETIPGRETGEPIEVDFGDLDRGPVHQV